MKAIVKTQPSKGAELKDMPIPEIADDEVLVKVKAVGVCGTDIHIYNWDQWSQNRIGEKKLPQILGHEMSGIVEKVGPSVKGVKVGDYVSAETHIYFPKDLNAMLEQKHIGEGMEILGVDRHGVFAEYVNIPERVLWHNDKSIPYELAAIQEPLGNACYAVLGEDCNIAGKSMVITGDGPISLMATAIARACGVTKIFLIGMSDRMMAIAKELGADYVLSVNQASPAERVKFVKDNTYGAGADIALEIVGNQQSVSDAFKCVRKGGRVSAFGISPQPRIEIDYDNDIVFKGVQIHGISGRKIFDTWYRVRNLLASGRLNVNSIITDMMMLQDFDKAFDKLTAPNRTSAKIVLFPDKQDLEQALKRRRDV
ncbi:MAG: alcohol dehydrogenase catalytic domain-containing protein [Candidatus Latescibacteria bacterium]|nr:alcohol dehydrogenase catalytic domain-containing protein [Candidatus Latescibacterota bacterium]